MSYIRVGGKVLKLYIPEKESELQDLFSKADTGKKTVIFGLASNFLLPDEPTDDFIYVSMKKMREFMEISENEVHISAGYNLMELIYKSAAKGTGENLFPLSGIPGTLGGCAYVNAGGSNKSDSDHIGNWITEIRLFDIKKKKVLTLSKSDLKFSYRQSTLKKMKESGMEFIILDLKIMLTPTEIKGSKMKVMKYIDTKLKTQPVGKYSLGCIFKNPLEQNKAAWEYIDELGDENMSFGTMELSSLHKNFIINNSKLGLASDFKSLTESIKTGIKKKFNIELEREVEYFSDYTAP